MAKKMDIEIMVDATEDLGLEATGRFNGSKFLGKITNKGLKLLTKEIGRAVVDAMSKTKDNDTDEVKEDEEAVEIIDTATTEEVIENVMDEEI